MKFGDLPSPVQRGIVLILFLVIGAAAYFVAVALLGLELFR
jgi:hypothetical protein